MTFFGGGGGGGIFIECLGTLLGMKGIDGNGLGGRKEKRLFGMEVSSIMQSMVSGKKCENRFNV